MAKTLDILRRSLVCLLILTLLSPTTLSMRFELHSGQMKCISEDIYEKSISVGKYFIVNPNEDHPLSASHKVIVKVVGYKSVPFKFDLLCCFWQMMDLSVKKLFNTVESIHDEMYYLHDREAEMQDLNRSTNSKMAWFSFLSLGVCLSVVGLQFWHLKSFFGKKKLI
ncbi:unnamed protein product [Brassica oleracea]|uniref:(rape) hypothetical protein n=1 Tax=Brassica napus TaxID=3708 RepID=A0A816KU24_BRANA|nr:unnamed protein product [Brassica napus]